VRLDWSVCERDGLISIWLWMLFSRHNRSSFLHFFPYLSPPLLVLSFENRPTPFPGRMSWKATKPGFSFLCLFSSFLLIGECTLLLCYVWFFRTKPRDWLGETSPKWPVLCRVGCITTAQLINPGLNRCIVRWLQLWVEWQLLPIRENDLPRSSWHSLSDWHIISTIFSYIR